MREAKQVLTSTRQAKRKAYLFMVHSEILKLLRSLTEEAQENKTSEKRVPLDEDMQPPPLPFHFHLFHLKLWVARLRASLRR